MRQLLVVLCLLAGLAAPARAEVSIGIGIGLPGVSIGINLPVYPRLVVVPGVPVYYAPEAAANYFFYDGMYWIYQRDNWYASTWFNGPWWLVGIDEVPLFILRVPVRYYRRPAPYFRGWRPDAPPRWNEHWGDSWQQRHRDWDRWDRRDVPRPAPLPLYQSQYAGKRYPPAGQQPLLQRQHYDYRPREPVVQRHFQLQQQEPAQQAQRQQQQQQPQKQQQQQRQQHGPGAGGPPPTDGQPGAPHGPAAAPARPGTAHPPAQPPTPRDRKDKDKDKDTRDRRERGGNDRDGH